MQFTSTCTERLSLLRWYLTQDSARSYLKFAEPPAWNNKLLKTPANTTSFYTAPSARHRTYPLELAAFLKNSTAPLVYRISSASEGPSENPIHSSNIGDSSPYRFCNGWELKWDASFLCRQQNLSYLSSIKQQNQTPALTQRSLSAQVVRNRIAQIEDDVIVKSGSSTRPNEEAALKLVKAYAPDIAVHQSQFTHHPSEVVIIGRIYMDSVAGESLEPA